jgi:hypothetical protein
MKVVAIEVAEAIEKEIANFLKDWGGGYAMRFTRFIDLGGKQTELYVYPPEAGATPWCTVGVRSVFKSGEGECIITSVKLPSLGKTWGDVMVSPEIWKLPALSDKILKFLKNDLLIKVNEGGGALEGGGFALEPAAPTQQEDSSSEEEDEIDDLDLEGILVSDDAEESPGFDPMDIIAAAQADSEQGGESDTFDPESIIREANEQTSETDESSSGFNPEDVIKD